MDRTLIKKLFLSQSGKKKSSSAYRPWPNQETGSTRQITAKKAQKKQRQKPATNGKC